MHPTEIFSPRVLALLLAIPMGVACGDASAYGFGPADSAGFDTDSDLEGGSESGSSGEDGGYSGDSAASDDGAGDSGSGLGDSTSGQDDACDAAGDGDGDGDGDGAFPHQPEEPGEPLPGFGPSTLGMCYVGAAIRYCGVPELTPPCTSTFEQWCQTPLEIWGGDPETVDVWCGLQGGPACTSDFINDCNAIPTGTWSCEIDVGTVCELGRCKIKPLAG